MVVLQLENFPPLETYSQAEKKTVLDAQSRITFNVRSTKFLLSRDSHLALFLIKVEKLDVQNMFFKTLPDAVKSPSKCSKTDEDGKESPIKQFSQMS